MYIFIVYILNIVYGLLLLLVTYFNEYIKIYNNTPYNNTIIKL